MTVEGGPNPSQLPRYITGNKLLNQLRAQKAANLSAMPTFQLPTEHNVSPDRIRFKLREALNARAGAIEEHELRIAEYDEKYGDVLGPVSREYLGANVSEVPGEQRLTRSDLTPLYSVVFLSALNQVPEDQRVGWFAEYLSDSEHFRPLISH